MSLPSRTILSLTALALTLGIASWVVAGGVSDSDGDLVPDGFDNCLFVPNGPLQVCNQVDPDMDGYGNGCDFDTNNDGATGLDDIATTYDLSQQVSTDAEHDFNCDGAVGLDDVAAVLEAARSVMTPGPSGLACAGTVPCTP